MAEDLLVEVGGVKYCLSASKVRMKYWPPQPLADQY